MFCRRGISFGTRKSGVVGESRHGAVERGNTDCASGGRRFDPPAVEAHDLERIVGVVAVYAGPLFQVGIEGGLGRARHEKFAGPDLCKFKNKFHLLKMSRKVLFFSFYNFALFKKIIIFSNNLKK